MWQKVMVTEMLNCNDSKFSEGLGTVWPHSATQKLLVASAGPYANLHLDPDT